MRRLIVALLAAGAAMAVAQDSFLSGDALRKDIERCAAGCVVFDRQEAAALEMAIEQIAVNAYRKGLAEGKCRL